MAAQISTMPEKVRPTTLRCRTCTEVKDVRAFTAKAAMKSGYHLDCKSCENARTRARRAAAKLSRSTKLPGIPGAPAVLVPAPSAMERRERAELQRARVAAVTSSDGLQHLRRLYGAGPVPPCRVCGAALAPRASKGAYTTEYVCSNRNVPIEDFLAQNGHHAKSLWRQTRPGDPRIIALIDFIEDSLTGTDEAVMMAGVLAQALGMSDEDSLARPLDLAHMAASRIAEANGAQPLRAVQDAAQR
ncbi:hypothetical protein [Nocardioides pacificus]